MNKCRHILGSSNLLAIVIPAYKGRYLSTTLQSIASQSCKDFVLYIGDDGSDEDLSGIIKPYEDRVRITYTRFPDNLGSVSLTKQWERCIRLCSREPYIWLFSDDDEMPKDAVQNFYREIAKSCAYDVYRYDMEVIDGKGEILRERTNYPLLQSDLEFFDSRVNDREYSCIAQFIFTRRSYERHKGFVDFPLAWSSDDATMLLYSRDKGIKRIDSPPIRWRLATGVNITSSKSREDLRVTSEFLFALWFNRYFERKLQGDRLHSYTETYCMKRLEKLSPRYMVKWNILSTVLRLLGLKKAIYVLIRVVYHHAKRAFAAE